MDESEIRSVLVERVDGVYDDPIDTDAITDETRLREDLCIDSLQTAEMLVEIEMRLGVRIEDEEAMKSRTVGEVLRLIQAKDPKLMADEE